MKKIDILVGENTYGTAVHFSKGLAKALERFGVKTRLFSVQEDSFFQAFYAILDDPPDLTCSFSDISLDKKPLGDLWQIPHLSLLVDPPIYFLHQLTTRCGWISCVDEEDCAFVRALGFSRVFFLPHATESALKTAVKKARPLEMVFFGSCIDYEAVADRWSPKERDLLLAASDRVLSAHAPSIAQVLLEMGVQEFDLPRLHCEVDRYTRGKERVLLIRSVQNHPLHIWGGGPWKKYFPSLEVHPPAPFEHVIEIMKQSQIVLNSSPRFKCGAHERIFYAFACGACTYTAENAYLKAQLPEAFTYRYGEWEAPSFKNWEASAEQGQQRVLNAHTWDARVPILLNAIKCAC